MKKLISFYSLFLFLQICFADIPVDKNGNNITEFTYFNYLPWVLGALGALASLVFMYVYKKETQQTK